MTTNNLISNKPLIYSLAGFIAGAVTASLLIYNLRPEPLNSVSFTTKLNNTATQPAVSPQVSPASLPTGRTGMQGMMAQADQHFIVMMIPHHEGAIAMAELAASRAKHPEVKKLAQTIKTTQAQEIRQMRAWYQQWYSTDVPDWTPGMGRGAGMMLRNRTTSAPSMPGRMGRGYMSQGRMGTDLNALKQASDFDREFLEQMIPHHQMAVMMSTMVSSSATHPEIRTLAQSIIRSQSAEIEQMQQWYQTWYAQ